MVVVTTVAAIVGVVVVVKVLMWVEAIVNMVVVVEVLVIDVLTDVEIIVVGAIVIVLKFALPVSYSVDVSSSDVTVDLFMYALAGVMIAVLNGIGIGVLTDFIANTFAVVMTALEFPVSTPLEGLSR